MATALLKLIEQVSYMRKFTPNLSIVKCIFVVYSCLYFLCSVDYVRFIWRKKPKQKTKQQNTKQQNNKTTKAEFESIDDILKWTKGYKRKLNKYKFTNYVWNWQMYVWSWNWHANLRMILLAFYFIVLLFCHIFLFCSKKSNYTLLFISKWHIRCLH